MLVRGVQPDVLAIPPGNYEPARAEFLARGAQPLAANPTSSSEDVSWEEVWWSVTESPARWLPKIDAIAIEILTAAHNPKDDNRLHWLRTAPRYLVRASQRYVKFSSTEADHFADSVSALTGSGAIPAVVTIRRQHTGAAESVALIPVQPQSE
jgi:hypothetical protein